MITVLPASWQFDFLAFEQPKLVLDLATPGDARLSLPGSLGGGYISDILPTKDCHLS